MKRYVGFQLWLKAVIQELGSPDLLAEWEQLFMERKTLRLYPRQHYYCTTNEASKVVCLPPAEQVIVIGHSRGVVRVPTIQAQLTVPSWLAVFVSSPLARLGPDL